MNVAILHVCTTCRAGHEVREGDQAPGARLHAHLRALAQAREDGAVVVLEAKCLSNCAGGCSASIAMPGKWSYLLGGLEIENASDLLDYAAIYAASATGVVMPSRRPASLATMVHGRIPALPDLSGNTA
ncbi:DUF1636 family protein [Lichenicoccus roseus]|uniref:DUF1636 domain-containing protein n=1 Tax=Lichenicoccus roseus TaxID=2683649 RepID=A0A5R9J9M2_9PROT|nr:DUF1636 domain-containing protein [Lichenicoccus roseus]TLU73247.1 DUF1636 domain-containing protein [Lichenicoccus roseus]